MNTRIVIAMLAVTTIAVVTVLADKTATVNVKVTVPPTAQLNLTTTSVTFDLPPANTGGRTSVSVPVSGTLRCNTPVQLFWHVEKPLGAPGSWDALATPTDFGTGEYSLGRITIIVRGLSPGQDLGVYTLQTVVDAEDQGGRAVLSVQVAP